MKFLLLISFFLLISKALLGQLTVTSVTPTVSTCPNNGTISIVASTAHPPLTYAIVSGPVIQPVQTSSTFTSLPPGTYTIDVANGAGQHSMQNVTITGTYTMLDFNPVKISPYFSINKDLRETSLPNLSGMLNKPAGLFKTIISSSSNNIDNMYYLFGRFSGK